MTPPFTGRCLSWSVASVAEAAPLWQSHCHCTTTANPDEMHLHAGTLDRPQDFAPEDHGHRDDLRPRVHLADGFYRT